MKNNILLYDNFINKKLYDVIIFGANIIGLSLACGLRDIGLNIAIVEKKSKNDLITYYKDKLEFSQVNIITVKFLKYLKIWNIILNKNCNPYVAIDIKERDNIFNNSIFFDKLRFSDEGLGYILDISILHSVLFNYLYELSCVDFFFEFNVLYIKELSNKTCIFNTNKIDLLITKKLVLTDNIIDKNLCVHYNISEVFQELPYKVFYTIVKTDKEHINIIRKRITNRNILIFLPLKNKHLNFVIWCLQPEIAFELKNQSNKYCNEMLEIFSDMILGRCYIQEKKELEYWSLKYMSKFIFNDVILIGDAGYIVYPLLSQRLNMNFMDVILLLNEFYNIFKYEKDIKYSINFKKFEHTQKKRITSFLVFMKIFQKFTLNHNLLVQSIKFLYYSMYNISFLKLFFFEKELEVQHLPDWFTYIDEDNL